LKNSLEKKTQLKMIDSYEKKLVEFIVRLEKLLDQHEMFFTKRDMVEDIKKELSQIKNAKPTDLNS